MFIQYRKKEILLFILHKQHKISSYINLFNNLIAYTIQLIFIICINQCKVLLLIAIIA